MQEAFTDNKSAWDRLDKEDIAERKGEWKSIKQNLRTMARMMDFESGYLKAHEQLYFKGVLSEQIGGYWPLFYLWYYPKLDETKCRTVMESIVGPDRKNVGRLKMIRHDYLLRQRFSQLKYETDYGFMGKREVLIFKELIGAPGKGAFFDEPGFYRESWLAPVVWAKKLLSTGGVLIGKAGYRYESTQHFWPHASFFIEKRFDKDRFGRDERGVTADLIRVIDMIVNFETHPKAAKGDTYAVQAKNRIMSQYENNEIYGHLRFLFDEVIKDGGKSLKQSFRKKLP